MAAAHPRIRQLTARLLAIVLIGVLGGCAPKFDYMPISAETNTGYGYRDSRNADGSYAILVVMPMSERDISLAQQYWDRRAAELCGHSNYSKNIFRAFRPTVPYQSYGAMPGDYYLEGYLHCESETPANTVATPSTEEALAGEHAPAATGP